MRVRILILGLSILVASGIAFVFRMQNADELADVENTRQKFESGDLTEVLGLSSATSEAKREKNGNAELHPDMLILIAEYTLFFGSIKSAEVAIANAERKLRQQLIVSLDTYAHLYYVKAQIALESGDFERAVQFAELAITSIGGHKESIDVHRYCMPIGLLIARCKLEAGDLVAAATTMRGIDAWMKSGTVAVSPLDKINHILLANRMTRNVDGSAKVLTDLDTVHGAAIKSLSAVFKIPILLEMADLEMDVRDFWNAQLHLLLAEKAFSDARMTDNRWEARLGYLRARYSYLQKELEASRRALVRAIEQQEKCLKADHTDLLDSLRLLAQLALDGGQAELANDLFNTILERADSRRPPYNQVITLSQLAKTDLDFHLEKQSPYYNYREQYLNLNRALSRMPGAFDELTKVELLKRLALFEMLNEGLQREAVAHSRQALELLDTFLTRVGRRLTPDDRKAHIRDAQLFLDIVFNQRSYQEDDLELIWSWKNRLLEMRAPRYCNVGEDSEAVKTANEKLAGKYKQLMELLFKTAGGEWKNGNRDRALELYGSIDDLEDEMATRCPVEQDLGKGKLLSAVKAALPERAFLLEFVRYNAIEVVDGKLASYPAYMAAVLNKTDARLIKLRDADNVDDAIGEFLLLLKNPKSKLADIRKAGRTIYSGLLDLVISGETGAVIMIVAPDGMLHNLPFGALPRGSSDTYLIQTMSISYVTTGKDILGWKRKPTPTSFGMLAVGDPSFDTMFSDEPIDRRNREIPSRGVITPCLDSGIVDGLQALPGSGDEVAAIATIYKQASDSSSMVLIKDQATEESLWRLMPQYSVVHIATHGFFFSNQCFRLRQTRFKRAEKKGTKVSGEVEVVKATVDFKMDIEEHNLFSDPMMLSGLIFTNPNISTTFDPNDGILTAAEILTMDLSRVNLITIAACYSGMGDITSPYGLMGMKSAVTMAGARGVTLSLWTIPDNTEFLKAFYSYAYHPRDSYTFPQALRQTAIEYIAGEDPVKAHPSYWAGYIYSGAYTRF